MAEYRHGSHSVFEIRLHLVWVTKHRKPVLAGTVGVRVRELIREVCATSDVLIIKGHVSKDHVHLLVSIPPQVTISRLVLRLKGKTAYKLLGEFAHLRGEFWGRHVWARGYSCCSSGNVTDEVVKQYIENRGRGHGDDFRVAGGPEGS
jgi:putative transposase